MVANPTRPSNPLAVLPPQSAPIARTEDAAIMALERVVTMGDLRDLTPVERVKYCRRHFLITVPAGTMPGGLVPGDFSAYRCARLSLMMRGVMNTSNSLRDWFLLVVLNRKPT